jgi:hypothetical protein
MSKNPWLVNSIEDFYILKCPECEFNTGIKKENSFQYHAVENHPMSFAFFGNLSDNSGSPIKKCSRLENGASSINKGSGSTHFAAGSGSTFFATGSKSTHLAAGSGSTHSVAGKGSGSTHSVAGKGSGSTHSVAGKGSGSTQAVSGTGNTSLASLETLAMDQICLEEPNPPSSSKYKAVKPKTKAAKTKTVKTKIGDLDKALREQGIGPQKVGNREAKEILLKSIKERDENYPVDLDFNCGDLEEELEGKRSIFKQAKELWQGITHLKSKDVPKTFNIETVTKFLKDSKLNVTINGESIDASVVKPVVSGRRMYYSHKVIDVKFMETDGKLLLISVMDSSMGKDRR